MKERKRTSRDDITAVLLSVGRIWRRETPPSIHGYATLHGLPTKGKAVFITFYGCTISCGAPTDMCSGDDGRTVCFDRKSVPDLTYVTRNVIPIFIPIHIPFGISTPIMGGQGAGRGWV